MTLYHNSPRTGKAARCRAKIQCLYGTTHGTTIRRDGTVEVGTGGSTWTTMEHPPARIEERIIIGKDGKAQLTYEKPNRLTNTTVEKVAKKAAEKAEEAPKKKKKLDDYVISEKKYVRARNAEEKALWKEEEKKEQGAYRNGKYNTPDPELINEKTGYIEGKHQPTLRKLDARKMVEDFDNWDEMIEARYGLEKFHNLSEKQLKPVAKRLAKQQNEYNQKLIESINNIQRNYNRREYLHPGYNMVEVPETFFTADDFIDQWKKNSNEN